MELPQGWYNDNELAALCDTAEKCGSMTGAIVEIGVYKGRSAQALAEVVPADRLVLIDNLADPGACTDAWPAGAQWITGPAVASLVWTNPIALLHIDGDHSYAGVLADLYKYAPFVKLGGFVVLHDWAEPAAGVSKAWHDWAIPGAWQQRHAVKQQAIFERILGWD